MGNEEAGRQSDGDGVGLTELVQGLIDDEARLNEALTLATIDYPSREGFKKLGQKVEMEMALLCSPFTEVKARASEEGTELRVHNVLRAMAEDVAAAWNLALQTGDEQMI